MTTAKMPAAKMMQTQRTTASAPPTARSSQFRTSSTTPPDATAGRAPLAPAPPVSGRSELLAALDDARDGLLDLETRRLRGNQRLDRLLEGLLVDLDDLRELGLELLQVLLLGDLPRPAHVGLGALTGLDHRRLLLVVELVVEPHQHHQQVG